MKNIVGAVPRGNNFFPREELINKIYRRLDADHLYLAAPRRMGKTAIMYHLAEQPKRGYEFKYLTTESIDDPITYLNELVKTLHSFRNWGEYTGELIREWLPRFNVSSMEIEFQAGITWEQHHDPFEKFKGFVKILRTGDNKKVIVMIDEFPQTIQNIVSKHGAEVAKQFLQFNREIRQLADSNLRFILTGSIGLFTVVEKLEATKTIDDLDQLEIPPLTQAQAKQFVTQLLDTAKVDYRSETCDELLQRIGELHPFYLQFAVQEIIDEFESTAKVIETSAVERALNKIQHHRTEHAS